MTSAVVYIPAAAHFATYAAQCLAYCATKGYTVTGVITTDWTAVLAVLSAQAAHVVVVARPDHLDPDRIPRIEVVDHSTAPAAPPRNSGPVPRRQRRPNQV